MDYKETYYSNEMKLIKNDFKDTNNEQILSYLKDVWLSCLTINDNLTDSPNMDFLGDKTGEIMDNCMGIAKNLNIDKELYEYDSNLVKGEK